MLSVAALAALPVNYAGGAAGALAESDRPSVFTLKASLRTIQLSNTLRTTEDQKAHAKARVAERRQALLDAGLTAAFIDRDKRLAKAIGAEYTDVYRFAVRTTLDPSFLVEYTPRVRAAAAALQDESQRFRRLEQDAADIPEYAWDGLVSEHYDTMSVLARQLHTQLVRDPFSNSQRALTSLRGDIKGWSDKSRANMLKSVASVDFSDWDKATVGMVTLTLPKSWETLCPDGATFKNMRRTFFKRLVRRWGVGSDACIWKMEFQRRGAPHFHFCMVIPGRGAEFREWALAAWAEIVGSEGRDRKWHRRRGVSVDFPQFAEGGSFDPGSIALYFLKYAGKQADGRSKEYQNTPPQHWLERPGSGPGRFWGIIGLTKTGEEVQLTEAQYIKARRIMRKMVDARIRSAGRRGKCKTYGRTRYDNSDGLIGGWTLFRKGSIATVSRLLEWVTLPDSVSQPPTLVSSSTLAEYGSYLTWLES